MKPRFNISKLAPDQYKAVLALDSAVRDAVDDKEILHLVKIRASQINGCAFCVDMHVKESLAHGMDSQKLHLVSVWRESSVFSPAERAVLDWTESVTLIADTGAPDDTYEALRTVISEPQIAALTVAIGTINLLNRVAVSSRLQHPTSADQQSS